MFKTETEERQKGPEKGVQMIVLASVGAICQAQLSRDPSDKAQRLETGSA